MKTIKNIKLIVAGIFLITLSFSLHAQGPPDPPGEHGSGEDLPPGANAPLSGGIFILLGLGAAYGVKKVYALRKKED